MKPPRFAIHLQLWGILLHRDLGPDRTPHRVPNQLLEHQLSVSGHAAFDASSKCKDAQTEWFKVIKKDTGGRYLVDMLITNQCKKTQNHVCLGFIQFVRQNSLRKVRDWQQAAQVAGGRQMCVCVCVSLLVSYLYSPPLIKCQRASCWWHHGGEGLLYVCVGLCV